MCGYFTAIDDAELAREASPAVPSERFYHALAKKFAREGPELFAKLHGAFVLVLQMGSKIHMVRNGAGARTAFYGTCGGRWLFSVEPKGIHLLPEFRKTVRPAALAQYLACSFVPAGGTMLEDIWEIPAGHVVTLEQGKETILTRWFHFEEEEHEDSRAKASLLNGRETQHWVGAFREQMERAVAERLPRGEPVGVFLSGGLDSSLVTAELARQIGGKNIKTWAIHFGNQYPHELGFARSVADRCGTDHREVLIRPKEFLPALRKMIWHLDDPIGDPITQPNFDLAALVSGEVRYIFNGEGGDPCFGGPKNIPMLLHHWYGMPRAANFREQKYLESYRRAFEEIELLLSEDVRSKIDPARDLDGVFRPYFEGTRPRGFLNKLMAINIREKGAHLILPKVERMTAAWGVTPLSPLFDERIIRLSFRMPADMKLHAGIEKYILKKAYENELPREVIDRPKSGMRVPVHFWFRSEMRRYARKILHRRDLSRAGLFDPARVKQLLAYDVEAARGRYGLRLWMLITFEIWRRIVVDGEAA
jgi:asparagine synthase (glutamine-hydrolysing)